MTLSKLLYLYNRHFPDRKLRLGRLLLEVVILKFHLLTIIDSEVDTKLLDQKCQEELNSTYSEAITLIQKHVRGYLARRHPYIPIKYDQTYHTASQFSKIRQLSPGSCMRKPFLRKYQKSTHKSRPPDSSNFPTESTLADMKFPTFTSRVHSPRATSPYRMRTPHPAALQSTEPFLIPAPPTSQTRRSVKPPSRNNYFNKRPGLPPSRQRPDSRNQPPLFIRPLSPTKQPYFVPEASIHDSSQTSNELQTISAVELYDRLFILDNKDLSVLVTGDVYKEREVRRNNPIKIRAIRTDYILSYLDIRTENDNREPFQLHRKSEDSISVPQSEEYYSVDQVEFDNSKPPDNDRTTFYSQSSNAYSVAPFQFEFDDVGRTESNQMENSTADYAGDSLYENETFYSSPSDVLSLDQQRNVPPTVDSIHHTSLTSDVEVDAAAICLQRFVRKSRQRNQDQRRLQHFITTIPTSMDPQFMHSALHLALKFANIELATLVLQRIDGLILSQRFPQSKDRSSFQPTNRVDMDLICQVILSFISVPEVFQIGIALLSTLSRIVNIPFLLNQMGDCRCCEIVLLGLSRYLKSFRLVNPLVNLLERLLREPSNRQHVFSLSGCRNLHKYISQCFDNSAYLEAKKLLQLTQQAIIGAEKATISNIIESDMLSSLVTFVTQSLERKKKIKLEPILKVLQALAVHPSSSALLVLTKNEILSVMCVALLLCKHSPAIYRDLLTLLLTLTRRCFSSNLEKFQSTSLMEIRIITYLISSHHPMLSTSKLHDDVMDSSLTFLQSVSKWEFCQDLIKKTNLSEYFVTEDFKKKFSSYQLLSQLYVNSTSDGQIIPSLIPEELLSHVLEISLIIEVPELTEQLSEDMLYTLHHKYVDPCNEPCPPSLLLLLVAVMGKYINEPDLQKVCIACLEHILRTKLGDVPFYSFSDLLDLVVRWKGDKILVKKYLELFILFDERCAMFNHPIDLAEGHLSLMIQLAVESMEGGDYGILERWCYLFRSLSKRYRHRLCVLGARSICLNILCNSAYSDACKISSLIIIPHVHSSACKECVTEFCTSALFNIYLTSLFSFPESCHEVVAFLIAVLGDGLGAIQSIIQDSLFASTFIELLDNTVRDLDMKPKSLTSEVLLVVLAFLVHCLQIIPTLRNQLINLGVRSRLLDVQSKVIHIPVDGNWGTDDINAINGILAHCIADLPVTPLNNVEDETDPLTEILKPSGDVLRPSELLDELSQRRTSISPSSPLFSHKSQHPNVSPAIAVSKQNQLMQEIVRPGRSDSFDYSGCSADELLAGLESSTNAAFLMTCLTRCVDEKDVHFARHVLRRIEVVLLDVKSKIRNKKGIDEQLHDSKLVQAIVRTSKEFINLLTVFHEDSEILTAAILLLKKTPFNSGEIDRLAEDGIFSVLHSILLKYSGIIQEFENTELAGLILLAADYAKQLLLHGGSAIREVACQSNFTCDHLTLIFSRIVKYPEQLKLFVHYLRELCYHSPSNQFSLLRAGIGSHLTKYLIEHKKDDNAVQLAVRFIHSLCSVGDPKDHQQLHDIMIRTLLSHRHLKLYVHIIRTNSQDPKISKNMCKFFMLLCTGKDDIVSKELLKSKVTEDLVLMIRNGVMPNSQKYDVECVHHILILIGHIVCYFPSTVQEFRSLEFMSILEMFDPSQWSQETMAMVLMLQRLFTAPSSIANPETDSMIDERRDHDERKLSIGENQGGGPPGVAVTAL